MIGYSSAIGAIAARIANLQIMKQDQPIDIYADNPVVTLAYKIAVMQKALEMGERVVQAKNTTENNCPGFINFAPALIPYPNLVWNWWWFIYRIDPAKRPFVMPGWNPNKLTADEVGLSEGWRLLHVDELFKAYKSNAPIDYLIVYHGALTWHSLGSDWHRPRFMPHENYSYRTNLAKDELARYRG